MVNSTKKRSDAVSSQFGLGHLGRAAALFAATLVNLPKLRYTDFLDECKEIAFQSIGLISLAALFVGAPLCLETVVELQHFEAQDYAGAVISIGLLRELGPLIVGLAWVGWLTAKIMADIDSYPEIGKPESGDNFAGQFILPRYLAALVMALPLSTYGLAIGFVVGALVAEALGHTTASAFYSGARMAIHNKDLVAYFAKLVLINPTIAVFTACSYGFDRSQNAGKTANALIAAFITTFIANCLLTAAMFTP
jgi:phospholipid/cholesterol/gamma-HCH transport system permease protein